jgi:rhamnosyltransferase subunit B
MRYLLTPVGSSGDVHPYVGIGGVLKARGHEVTVFSAEPHRTTVEAAGLEFVSTVTTEQYEDATRNPDLWHPRRGFETVLRMIAPSLEDSYRELEARYVPGESFLVGHPLSLFARIFEDKTGCPAATLHLAPSSIRSVYQVPALPPGVDISGLPRWLKRLFWYLVDRRAIDPLIEPALNRFRATLGLAPVRRIYQSWINSPQLVIGLFPDWFGSRQPDWPAHCHQASFPLWDAPGGAVDQELAGFLDGGSPPVVASPGTANRHAAAFFSATQAALTRLGLRGLFLTGFLEQLPPDLPKTTMVRRYAPFSAVLPRARAFVHHGGIGTLAQGLAAGTPQLVMPMAFDQPDNALRAARLGVARWLAPANFTAERVAAALTELQESPAVRTAAGKWRDRLRQVDGIAAACDMLERQATKEAGTPMRGATR